MFEGIDSSNAKFFTPGRHIYYVPSRAKALYFCLLSGGGGGGGGASGPPGSTRGGGGGGSTASAVVGILPTIYLPPSLLIIVGSGGNGGDPGAAGGTGAATGIFVPTTQNQTSLTYRIVQTQSAGGGGAGNQLSTALGGTTNVGSINGFQFSCLEIPSSNNRSGGPGGAVSGSLGGNSDTIPNAAGAGGGGVGTNDVAFAGGFVRSHLRQMSGGTANGGNGINGTSLNLLDSSNIFLLEGGSGGGSSGTGTGGNGGDGGLGAGGGGGGAGVTGGRGGRGGPGLAIIVEIF